MAFYLPLLFFWHWKNEDSALWVHVAASNILSIFLAASRAIVDDTLDKDKNYLVKPSTRDGEESNDEENEEGHKRTSRVMDEAEKKEVEEEVEKVIRKAMKWPWNEQKSIEQNSLKRIRKVMFESGSLLSWNLWWEIKYDKVLGRYNTENP